MSKKSASSIDPRKLRTRQLIRAAFLELIHEKGFDAVSIQDITDRATLNRATFYLHYKDKHDLMVSLMQEVLDKLSSLPMPLQPSRPQEPDPERLGIFFVSLFQHVAQHADFYRVMVVEESVAPFAGQMQAYIEQFGLRWFARARQRQFSVRPEVVMSYLSGAYMGMIKWWLKNDMPISPQDLAAQFMQLALPGIIQIDQTE
ncbi:MAG: TetR family transcriptional regulator [Anaerolineaceae bacterium]|nr:TetR family transcriptional regulator [Anaerolineaceae bacterium]